MNRILLSWTIPTHLVMGSLLGPMTQADCDGEPPWSNDPDERCAFDSNFDEFGDYTQRAIQTLSILDDSSSTLTPCPTLMSNHHVINMMSVMRPLTMKNSGLILVGSMWILFREPWNSLPNGESLYLILSL